MAAANPNVRGPVWARPGFRYVCKGLVERSRANFDLILLIHNTLRGDDLPSLLRDATQRNIEVYYAFDTGSETRLKLQADRDIASTFRMFVQTLHPPFSYENFDYRKWVARLLIPHLLLSTAKWQWRGLSTNLIFRHASNSVMAMLLKFFWHEVVDDIQADLRRIMANLDIVFCPACTPDCPLQNIPAHFQLHRFDELPFLHDLVHHGMFTRMLLFGAARPVGDDRLIALQRINQRINAFGQQSLDEAFNCIQNSVANTDQDVQFCCYLLLILQGPNLQQEYEEDLSPNGGGLAALLERQSVMKLLYVGVTNGTTFRRGHFTNPSSAVYKALSRNAKMYFLRRFVTNSRLQAVRNEAFVIEILKTIVTKNVQLSRPLPFHLLNQYSGPSALLGVDDETLHEMLDFVDLERPIFSATSATVDLTNNPAFEGNHSLLTPIAITNPHLSTRRYGEVRDYMREVTSRNKNARFFNYKTD